jgi:uncharacterized coiled-coil protein SlyX
MIRSILCCAAILALLAAGAPARAEPNSATDNCEARIGKLEASQAEGEERLAEKNEVIGHCASQYKRDKTIERLVKECQKYQEQPVVKQQFVAECQLAAFNYANALYSLKAEYRK